jgi:DnaJ-class molecular chaperone
MISGKYNWFKRTLIFLKDGEQFCDKCGGWGVVSRTNPNKKVTRLTCSKCLGEGKLDWVEKVTGKKADLGGTMTDTPGRGV